jgi:Pentapeptide repeats (9 copies)
MEGATTAIAWDDETFERVLERLANDGTIDASGQRISRKRLLHISDAAPPDPDRPGSTLLKDAKFGGAMFEEATPFAEATFGGVTDFREATFGGVTDFRKATFSGDALFGNATFSADALFDEASFGGRADFDTATFSDIARFNRATFSGPAFFRRAIFGADASFAQASFGANADFSEATFEVAKATSAARVVFVRARFDADARFRGAIFSADAHFGEASFGGRADFDTASFEHEASFVRARFERAQYFGPLLAVEQLALDGAAFGASVQIVFSGDRLSCTRTTFSAGAKLWVRWAEISLDEADLVAPAVLNGLLGANLLLKEDRLREWIAAKPEARTRTPEARLVSLNGTNVKNLILVNVDLRACRFGEASDLDQLRVQGSLEFESPHGLRWTRRRAVAEEHIWRARRGQRGWYPAACQPPEWLDKREKFEESPSPRTIGSIYRALRKRLEDSKDEPGAADFYYGEMEMRRAAGPPWAEGVVLWLYWLVSGYGLRASRALIALAITIALGGVLLGLFGFDAEKHPDDGALLFAAESSISLLRPPDTKNLTAVGHVVQIVLRLAGPLFFGLALLSLRGRVKR